jgi:ubiquinone/menaquinone biosynthesis C-methylase UbiE
MTTTEATTETVRADQELKARHRAMWALGDYGAVAHEVIADLGPVLVEAAGVGPGQRVLDVAAGTGNVAVPAALAGADVVASDLTPELLDAGRRAADHRGARVDWREGDAEALPFADGAFDATVSCVGVMFAPHHQVAADELVRVTRPGGTLGLVSWTPEGFIGQMLAVMRPFAPSPPPGAQPPPLWGRPEHVRGLLGDRASVVREERRLLRVDRFRTAEEFRDFFKATYGPTIVVYRAIADDPGKVATLDADLVALAERFAVDGEDGLVMGWEYLLLTARTAA